MYKVTVFNKLSAILNYFRKLGIFVDLENGKPISFFPYS